ncbi:MAG: YkgJ family cysteine cluster protein [Deltaproteobacteria bacterium]|nr:MAG: YkgJ family cysteine cluster protein [Deltaproteobacteria bacterium]
MTENSLKTECDRCGTCCEKGGPALHQEDRVLLQENWLNPDHLITIRKGEPVFSLDSKDPAPAQSELVKIKGKGSTWTCIFFQENEASCSIYEHRPLECSLLKCWDTLALEKVSGRNLLSRYDIIAPYDPVLPFIKTHEEKCSLDKLDLLFSELSSEDTQNQAITLLTTLVNTDLSIRSQAYTKFHFSLDLELFYFGRPLFKILEQFGIKTHEKNGNCILSLQSSFVKWA